MRQVAENFPRKYHLWIVVDGKEIYGGYQFSIKEFLMVLSKWEKEVEGFEGARMEIEEEDE